MNNKILFASLLMALQPAMGMAQNATINVDVKHPTHAISPTLFGIFLGMPSWYLLLLRLAARVDW